MISRAAARCEPPPPVAGLWRRLLAEGVRDAAELLALLGLQAPSSADGRVAAATRRFPLRVPRGYVARMIPGDPADPLLRQVLPLAEEETPVVGFVTDPVGDRRASLLPGLLAKYHGRVLLVVTGACPVHCRYCFRRHFPYEEHAGASRWEEALAAIAADPTVEEVILSGGDPLVLPDERLAVLAARLAAIPQLRRLRVHSRMPVVLPERVDEGLLGWLAGTRLSPLLVIHANHPREIDEAVAAALGRLRSAGVPVLNQAVLLAGVNDDAAVLSDLSERLFDAGVLPYYLHLLDRVAGAAHFEVPEETGRWLIRQLLERLPGYLVPRLVREVPGAGSKLPLDLRLSEPVVAEEETRGSRIRTEPTV